MTSPHGAKETVAQSSKFILKMSQSVKKEELSRKTDQKNTMHVTKQNRLIKLIAFKTTLVLSTKRIRKTVSKKF